MAQRAFGYLVSGVCFYGLLGWAADHWLGTRYLVVAGIFAGAALGIYLTVRSSSQAPEEATRDTGQHN